MRASINASYIVADMKREEYYKKKAERNKCIIDNTKQCDKCQYKQLCENNEVNNEH